MLSRRIIPCLDVRNGRVVKGVRFRDHVDMGDIIELASRYREAGADELVFYDISASPDGRAVNVQWVECVASTLDIPFTVAGGIRDVETAARILSAGADKISINTPALLHPELIADMADRFGIQCIVVGIDSECVSPGQYRVRSHTGDPSQIRRLELDTMEWIVRAQNLGAGEIVLNCMDRDGVRTGYDVDQLKAARQVCRVPLIASGGAGSIGDFASVFSAADVDGALAASVFHGGVIGIHELKQHLHQQGHNVRLQP